MHRFLFVHNGKVTKRSSQIDEQMGHHLNQPAATGLLTPLKRKAKGKDWSCIDIFAY